MKGVISMLDIQANLKLFAFYVSVIDTKARVLESSRNSVFSEYSKVLMQEVEKLDEIKEKTAKLIWSA